MTLTILTDVGSVAELSLSGSQDRIDLAVVDDTFLTPPIGVLLTNAVSPDDGNGGTTGGYCVVGSSDPMVVKLVSTSGQPAAGAKLYLQKSDGTAGGASDAAVLDATYNGPCPLGYCLPVGPTGATRLRYITWEPQPPNGVTAQRSISLSITSSTTLVDYASVPVKAGRRYLLEADLDFGANAAGGIDVAWAIVGGFSNALVQGEIIGTAPTTTLAKASETLGPGDRLGAVGPTAGLAKLRGLFTCAADGTVAVQASQHASNGAATTVFSNSWFRVTEV